MQIHQSSYEVGTSRDINNPLLFIVDVHQTFKFVYEMVQLNARKNHSVPRSKFKHAPEKNDFGFSVWQVML